MLDDIAFAGLDGAEIEVFEGLGQRRSVVPGDYLVHEGEIPSNLHVVVSGAVDVVVRSDGEERILGRRGAGQFVGELGLLTGQRAFVWARVAEPGEVIAVPLTALRHVLETMPGLGDKLLAAFLARRSNLLRDAAAAVRVVGSRYSPQSVQLREFLSRNRITHEWIDAEGNDHVEASLRHFGVAPSELPVVIASGAILRRTTPESLASFLGLTISAVPGRCFDLVIVGGGPAGLGAAVYGASEGLRTLALESVGLGGQAGTSSRIENYLGFPAGISGSDLAERAVLQAEKFGAQFTSPSTATHLREQSGHLVLRLSDGSDVTARAAVIASGARYRRLDAARLEEFETSGVYYAATEIEARLCAGSPVAVVGGGNSAGQAALFLAGGGSKVTVVVRGTDLAKNMSRYLVDRIEADDRIAVRTATRVTGLEGERRLTALRVNEAGEDHVLPCVGLFSFIGAEPAAAWLSGCAALDDAGFVLTDRSLRPEQLDERWQSLDRRPLPFETSHPGLFAVGDVRAGSIKRVAAAVGEGAASVRSVHEYLAFSHQ